MEWTGKVLSVGTDWLTGQMNITLSINERSALQEIDSIKDCEKLSIKAVKHRNKRSLDSNAYAWVLMQKIAEAVNSDRWSVYLEMLKKYSREFTFVICKEHAVDKLKEVNKGTDLQAIKDATDEVQKAFYAVSEKLYQNAAPQDGNCNGDCGNCGGDDNVVDADYQTVD